MVSFSHFSHFLDSAQVAQTTTFRLPHINQHLSQNQYFLLISPSIYFFRGKLSKIFLSHMSHFFIPENYGYFTAIRKKGYKDPKSYKIRCNKVLSTTPPSSVSE
jgi:hypothetical protein